MRKTKGYWDIYENCYAEAKKYKRKYEFQKSCRGAYNAARRNGWLSEMDWFEEMRKPNGYWTKEKCYQEGLKYKTKSEFKKSSPKAYDAARRNGWIPEMTWFVNGKKPNGYWDIFENVQREAKKCKNRRGLQKSCSRAYLKA